MARYTGPKTKIARKFGEPIFGEDKVLQRRNFPPGQHGQNKRRKTSEYGVQLREKQKAKYTYGVLEKQFRNLYNKASRLKGVTVVILLQLLEARLDNVVYRMGIAESKPQARQFVLHGHITVNGKKVDIPSFRVNAGDVIAVKESSASKERFKQISEQSARPLPKWLTFDLEQLKGTVVALPDRDDIDLTIEEHYIVELYSK